MVISCYAAEKGRKCKGGRHWLDELLADSLPSLPSENAVGLVSPSRSARHEKTTPSSESLVLTA